VRSSLIELVVVVVVGVSNTLLSKPVIVGETDPTVAVISVSVVGTNDTTTPFTSLEAVAVVEVEENISSAQHRIEAAFSLSRLHTISSDLFRIWSPVDGTTKCPIA
jgi:hypothetical protein